MGINEVIDKEITECKARIENKSQYGQPESKSWMFEYYNNFMLKMPTLDEKSNQQKREIQESFEDICAMLKNLSIYNKVVGLQEEIWNLERNPLFQDYKSKVPERDALLVQWGQKVIELYTLIEPAYLRLREKGYSWHDLCA